jgi:hypothetical protein
MNVCFQKTPDVVSEAPPAAVLDLDRIAIHGAQSAARSVVSLMIPVHVYTAIFSQSAQVRKKFVGHQVDIRAPSDEESAPTLMLSQYRTF